MTAVVPPRLAPALAFGLVAILTGYSLARVPEAPLLAAVVIAAGSMSFLLLARVHAQSVVAESTVGAGFLRGLMLLLIVMLVAYQLAFNYLSDNRRLQFAGVVALGLVAVAVVMLLGAENRQAANLALLLYGGVLAANLVGALLSLHGISAAASFRSTFPLAVAGAMVLRPRLIPIRAIGWLVVLTTIAGLAISYSHGKQLINDAFRLSPFTGGALDGIHASAYLFALCAIILNELRRQQVIRPWLVWPTVLLDGFGIYELKVATAMVMFLVYFGLRGLTGRMALVSRIALVTVLALVAGLVYQTRVQDRLTAPFGPHTVTADSLSSGRLSAWQTRFDIVDSRAASLLVFGSGIGSDELSFSTAWNGQTKDSHNDFLTLLIDQGLIGFVLYVTLTALLAKLAGRESWPIVAALLVTSALSNAMYTRPMIAVFLWLAVAISARRQTVASPVAEAVAVPAPEPARKPRPAPARAPDALPARRPLAPSLIAATTPMSPSSAMSAARSRRSPLSRPRVGLGFVDQALSSVTNFAGTATAAKILVPAELGHFAVVAAIYVLILVATRGIVCEPMMIVHSARRSESRSEMRVAAGAAIGVGVVAGALTAIAALFLAPSLAGALLVLAVLLPGLLLQDFLRFYALTLARPAAAVAVDGLWLILQGVAVGILASTTVRSPAVAVAAWLLPGALAGLVGVLGLKLRPRLAGARSWLTRNAPLGARFAADNLLGQNVGLGLVLVLALVSAPAQVGFYRVALTALMPPALLNAGLRFAIIPELVRLRGSDMRRFNVLVQRAAVLLSGTIAVWGLGVWLLPVHLGSLAFGASWPGAHNLVPLTTVSVAAGGATMAAFSGIRACADARGSLRTMARVAAVQLSLGTLGAVLDGAMGATIALAVAVPAGTLIWWLQYRRSRQAVEPAMAVPSVSHASPRAVR